MKVWVRGQTFVSCQRSSAFGIMFSFKVVSVVDDDTLMLTPLVYANKNLSDIMFN